MGKTTTDAEILYERVRVAERFELMRKWAPSDFYRPHSICRRGPRTGKPTGQDRFHKSTHLYRVLAPGNGWGGTVALGVEVDQWARGTNRWRETPKPPVCMWWMCPDYRQFESIRTQQLEPMCFGRGAKFGTSEFGGPQYKWPNGSRLYIFPFLQRQWYSAQGIEPHLVVGDEKMPRDLWDEMEARNRTEHGTAIITKATQTEGWTWMAEKLYTPWAKHHKDLGIMDEEQMLLEQRHPTLWLWHRGGIHDNPAVPDVRVAEQEQRVFRSKKERQVKLFGGFESFVGDPVFDEEAMEWMEAEVERLDREREPAIVGSMQIGTRAPKRRAVARVDPRIWYVRKG